ncbi:MAG TPA: hypothetical protein ENF17_09605 [Candidatus Aminicenantes bacterium]|nr:hypothetical protein [Candidatus Aminicenantes bacterium]
MKTYIKLIGLTFILFLFLALPTLTQTNPSSVPKAQLPVLITSAGQSPDVTTVNIIAEEAGIPYDYCDVPTVELVKAGVGLADKKSGPGFHVEIHTDLEKFPKGTAYQTMIMAIGASLKGMGASGLTVESEIKRLQELIDYAQKNNIFIIAIHVGGASKRGAPGSDNEKMIDAVAPFANLIIVTKDSNRDGRFDQISQTRNIPLLQVDNALEIVELFKQIFL